MAARETSQIHAVRLELQQVLVAVNAAEYLANPIDYPFANLLSVRVIPSLLAMDNVAARRFERVLQSCHY